MSILGTLGLIGTGLGAIGNIISASGGASGQAIAGIGTGLTQGVGTVSAIRGSEEQAALSREVFDYQRNLQNLLFEREDNAVQRRVKDLEAAGLSRTLAAGNGAGAGTPVTVSTPQSESALRGQALSQGVANMLSIAQAKANIALTEANAKKADSEAAMNNYDLTWYENAGLPTGAKSGIVFLLNSIVTNLGLSNRQAVGIVTNVIVRIAKKFGIDFSEAAAWFGDTLNESSSSINSTISLVGKNFSVGISRHGIISVDPVSGSSDPDVVQDVEKKVYDWSDKYLDKRLLKKLLKSERYYSEGRRVVPFTSGGGIAW